MLTVQAQEGMMGNLYPTQPWSKTMLVTRAFPEPVDPILQTLPLSTLPGNPTYLALLAQSVCH